MLRLCYSRQETPLTIYRLSKFSKIIYLCYVSVLNLIIGKVKNFPGTFYALIIIVITDCFIKKSYIFISYNKYIQEHYMILIYVYILFSCFESCNKKIIFLVTVLIFLCSLNSILNYK